MNDIKNKLSRKRQFDIYKKLVFILIIFFLSLSTMCYTTYAWFEQRIQVEDNIISSGKWVYIIFYYLDGGQNNQLNNDFYYSYKDSIIYAPARQDYEFLGWYNNAQFTGNPITFISKNTRGDKELYAKWKFKGTEGLKYSYDNKTNEYTVSGGNINAQNLYIPKYYNNIPVTIIDSNAFSNNNINTVEFNEGLRIIENNAFRNCNNLSRITIPSTVTKIGANAFNNCSNLQEIVIRRNHTQGITEGNASMFKNIANDYKIFVPSESLLIYRNGKFWSDYADNILSY